MNYLGLEGIGKRLEISLGEIKQKVLEKISLEENQKPWFDKFWHEDMENILGRELSNIIIPEEDDLVDIIGKIRGTFFHIWGLFEIFKQEKIGSENENWNKVKEQPLEILQETIGKILGKYKIDPRNVGFDDPRLKNPMNRFKQDVKGTINFEELGIESSDIKNKPDGRS
ncbi:hypothetical protein K9M41_03455 [Candidatus Gracilibacteria bacterium]|nr:hypothetical protein [Candidatus Gracilibacteria bacterium]